jgi:hypothetical protein
MHVQAVQPGGIGQYLIPLAVFVVIFAFRARRMSRSRPLKLGQLWVVPALYAVIVILSLAANPPRPVGWALLAGGVVIGAALGWYRGKTISIHVDPETGTLRQKASPLAMLVLLVLVGAKAAMRAGGTAAHLDVNALTDAALGIALGTFATMRVEMYLRARRLLAEQGAG